MKFISGKKLSMTQIWSGDEVFAVTPVLAGPCVVTQVKTKTTDGYNALQLAFGIRKEKNIKKPQRGHFLKAGVKPTNVREFKTEDAANFKIGDVVSADVFVAGESINVTGVSKGRGFQGVVKRHHFHGFRKTHGNKDQERMPGSIGPKGPAHVFKGTRMGGRMGGERVTTTNLEIASVDEENNILFIKGAVPGAINGFVTITGNGELKVNLKKEVKAEVVEEKVADIAASEEAAVTEVVKETAEAINEGVKEEIKEEAK
jgi:large subunit ribosomal protein L3